MAFDQYLLYAHQPVANESYRRDLWLVPVTAEERVASMTGELELPEGYENGHDPAFLEHVLTITLLPALRYDRDYGSASYLRRDVERQKDIFRDHGVWIENDLRVIEARVHPLFFLRESSYVEEHGYTRKQVKPTYDYRELLAKDFAPEEIAVYPYGECQLDLREGLVALEKMPAYLASLRWHHKAVGQVMAIYPDSLKVPNKKKWARDHWSSLLVEFGEEWMKKVPTEFGRSVRIKHGLYEVEAIVAREAYEVGDIDLSPPGGVLFPSGIVWPEGWTSRRPEGSF